MGCARLKTGIFVGIGAINSPDWNRMVATQVTYTPFGLAFCDFKKGSLIL